MRAIVLTEYGGPEKLQLREEPEPQVGVGEIKVRVRSASLNPVDWKLRSGLLKQAMPLELPAVLGRDAAGEVVELGAGVTAFHVGERVLGLVRNAYAELTVASVEAWAKLPEGLAVEDAGAYPLVLLTGAQLVDAALGSVGAEGAGLSLLVTGAAGSVGRVAVWVAKQRGCTVLAGVRASQLEEAEKLGADQVVALDDEGALARLAPVDRIADTVGGDTIAKLLPKLKPGGMLGSALGEPAAARGKDLTVHAFYAHPDSNRLAELAAAVASGTLVIPIARRFPLAEAAAAHALAERGVVGKVLLLP